MGGVIINEIALAITENNLLVVSKMLLEMNTVESNENCCMLIIDLQLLGHISEVEELK